MMIFCHENLFLSLQTVQILIKSKYKMGNPILILSTCMGKSIRIKRVKKCCFRLEKKFLSDYVNYVSVFELSSASSNSLCSHMKYWFKLSSVY